MKNQNIDVINTNYRILVVDDNNSHLKLLEDWLCESGFSVVAVNDGGEAIKRLNREQFDLVLTDLCMPGIDGLFLARYIHRLNSNLPVVAVTAVPDLAGELFDLVLSKPYELERLVISLQYVLQRFPTNAAELNKSKREKLYQLGELRHGH